MKRSAPICGLVLLLATLPLAPGQTTHYVNHAAGGANHGTSWTDAFTSLTAALSAAVSGDQVWVAAGTYKPGAGRGDSFAPRAGVSLYGGFAGTESSLAERDWTAQVTTLSGDIDGNGVLDAGNSYHVVDATAATNGLIDGFTVTMGYALQSGADADPARDGGGLLVHGKDVFPRIYNCRFIQNAAYYRGGAIYLSHASAGTEGAVISNCTFEGNYVWRTAAGGGAVFQYYYRPLTILDSTFAGNTNRASHGGAVYVNLGGPQIRGCVFRGNETVGGNGGAVYVTGVRGAPNNAAEIRNCRFYANRLTTSGNVSGGALCLDGDYQAGDLIRDCDFYANESRYYGGAVYLTKFDGVMEDCRFSGNLCLGNYGGALYMEYSDGTFRRLLIAGHATAYGGGGLYAGTDSRPVLENLLVAGNRTRYNGGGVALADLTLPSDPREARLVNCTIAGNRTWTGGAAYGGGGVYLNAGTATVVNCCLFGNATPANGAQAFVDTATSVVGFDHNDLQGGFGAIYNPDAAVLNDLGGNMDANPVFQPADGGTWTAPPFTDAEAGTTLLTDGNGSWADGALAGRFLNPDTAADNLSYYIAANTRTTVTVWGLVTNAFADSPYAVLDYNLGATSPCKDAGTAAGAPDVDLLGISRPQGAGHDIGALENVLDGIVPSPVIGLSAAGGLDQITLSWTNPPDADFAGVVILRRQGAAPTGAPRSTNRYAAGTDIGNGTVVYVGRGTDGEPGHASSWTDYPLPALTLYHYAVFAYDGVPNYASGAGAEATTAMDGVAPSPVSGLAAVGGDHMIALSWVNPADADFTGVLITRHADSPPTGRPENTNTYGLGALIGDGQVLYVGPGSDGTPGQASSWTNGGLPFDAGYFYAVFAYDEAPNYADGASVEGRSLPNLAMSAVCWLPFTNGTGSVATDDSGNGNHGRLGTAASFAAGAGPTLPGSGKTLDAVELSGAGTIDNSLLVSQSPTMNFDKTKGTIVLWINPDTLPGAGGWSTFVKPENFGGSDGFDFMFNGTLGMFFSPKGWNWWYVSSVPLLVGGWQHLTVTWDAITTNIQFYVNGALDAGSAWGSHGKPPAGFRYMTTTDWRLGWDVTVADGRPFDGRMADFAVFPDVLPGSQIALIYSNGVAGARFPEPPKPVTGGVLTIH